ncbi:serine hydrolase [Streptomyces verrucosisporus]|uniref:serine hydrolase n=1 Tax=Streptomyces verrucosisporus TaxID=1695161 RepID=UPI001F126443|nr:serine hydrolase [Streptomyces verrucosisporus]
MGETTGEAGTVPERARDPRVALYEAPGDEAGTGGEEPSPNGDGPAGAAGAAGSAEGGDTARTAVREPETREPEETGEPEKAGEPEAAGEDASAGGDEPAGGESGAGPVDQATAVFRTPEDKAEAKAGTGRTDEDADADAEEADGGTGPAEDRDPAEDGGAGAGPVDQATAVFRTPEDKAGSRAGERTGDGGGGEEAGADRPVDQPTAMFRVRPESASEEPGSEDPGEAADPGEPEKTQEPEKAGEQAESDAERTSRFVPLRSADAPRVPPAVVSPEQPPHTPGPELPEAERTRQQPLPPHRPLELLAELTNKPAPPETPVRVALRRIKIWSPLVLLLVIALAVAQLMRPLPAPELVLTASATHTFEGDEPTLAWPPEGQAVLEVEGLGSLGSYGEEKPVPIASVAKVMTAYVILRDHPLKAGEEGPRIPVDAQAEKDAGLSAQGESTVEVEEGEEITLDEALHALMIASANNVARLLARWDSGGSEKAFVEKMNAAAEELGMENTTYTDASGLRKDTVSTAADQVELGKKVMDYEAFREIVKKPSYKDRNGVSHRNWNGLVPYNRAVGIKTGTTTAAGGNLLFAGEKEVGGTTQLIIGAMLGQHKPPIIDTVIAESRELLVSAQEVLKSEKIVAKGDVVGYVDDGLGGRTPLVATEDVSAVGWSGLKVELALTDGGKGVPHTAAPGDTVGTLTVGSGPGQVKVPVAVRGELAEPDLGTRLTRVL